MTNTPIYSKYDTPTDVLTDKTINQAEKIKILESWITDEEALIRASAEGMGGGERPHLRQAQKALETLKETN